MNKTAKITYRSNNKVYHTDDNCPHMNRSDQNFRPVDPKQYPEYRECQWCEGDKDVYGNRNKQQEVKECTKCGMEYKRLPAHLRSCPER